MSYEPIIQVENLSKCFSLYNRPVDRLKEIFKKVPCESDVFWALRGLNFEVERGQTVGVIGQNGSGKSTLLQILAGLMKPTEGCVKVRGKVAALLELGSGFNPEFTGRQNVYLNGALLGLTAQQINERFDDIAAFADIGVHLEQPVKTYSSGMMLRLAFAVQVFVETEILIIDEALAVGDARFQLKCFKRLNKLKEQGVTILFVSHAYDLVKSFCNLGLVLNKGIPVYWGDAKTATTKYLATLFPEKKEDEFADSLGIIGSDLPEKKMLKNREDEYLIFYPGSMKCYTFGSGGAEIKWIKIFGLKEPNIMMENKPMIVQCALSWDIEFINNLNISGPYQANLTIGFALADKKGNYIFGCNGFDSQLHISYRSKSSTQVEFKFTPPYLNEGDYFMTFAIALGNLDSHVQLKWYDYLIQLSYMKEFKNVFGLVGIDYSVKEQSVATDNDLIIERNYG